MNVSVCFLFFGCFVLASSTKQRTIAPVDWANGGLKWLSPAGCVRTTKLRWLLIKLWLSYREWVQVNNSTQMVCLLLCANHPHPSVRAQTAARDSRCHSAGELFGNFWHSSSLMVKTKPSSLAHDDTNIQKWAVNLLCHFKFMISMW